MLINHKDSSHMENYNHRDFSDFHGCFFHHPLSPSPHLYVSCLHFFFLSRTFFQRTVLFGELHPCMTNYFCGFSSFSSLTFPPHLNPSLETCFSLNRSTIRTWMALEIRVIKKKSLRSYWKNKYEGKSWWVWDESPPARALVRFSDYLNQRVVPATSIPSLIKH